MLTFRTFFYCKLKLHLIFAVVLSIPRFNSDAKNVAQCLHESKRIGVSGFFAQISRSSLDFERV